MPTTDTNVSQVVVNKLTKAQYDSATKSATEFYAVTDGKITNSDIDWGTLRKVLWTNSDPTSNQAYQTFTVAGLSDWEYIAVTARTHTSQNYMNIFKAHYSNGGIEVSFSNNSNTLDRSVTWSGNSVTFENGRLNANQDNSRCVILEIVGMNY